MMNDERKRWRATQLLFLCWLSSCLILAGCSGSESTAPVYRVTVQQGQSIREYRSLGKVRCTSTGWGKPLMYTFVDADTGATLWIHGEAAVVVVAGPE